MVSWSRVIKRWGIGKGFLQEDYFLLQLPTDLHTTSTWWMGWSKRMSSASQIFEELTLKCSKSLWTGLFPERKNYLLEKSIGIRIEVGHTWRTRCNFHKTVGVLDTKYEGIRCTSSNGSSSYIIVYNSCFIYGRCLHLIVMVRMLFVAKSAGS